MTTISEWLFSQKLFVELSRLQALTRSKNIRVMHEGETVGYIDNSS